MRVGRLQALYLALCIGKDWIKLLPLFPDFDIWNVFKNGMTLAILNQLS